MSGPVQGDDGRRARIAVLWRGDADAAAAGIASNERLRPIIDALTSLGAVVEPIVYRDAIADAVQQQLANVEGVLVWVDPVGKNGETREQLDDILRTIAARGVWVSAHPDVIAVIGTKDVLYRTRNVGWGHDVHLYGSIGQMDEELPARLAVGPRVLKQHRGNGGIGVWKVEATTTPITSATTVAVHEARIRDLSVETMPLSEFYERCASCFADDGFLVDQPFQPRVAEGLIRVYVVGDKVAGFAVQGPGDLVTQPNGADLIMGLPSPKEMFPADHPQFARLRRQLEEQWLDRLQASTGLDTDDLPALWDIDFLLGPKSTSGEDTYVLCEINASCITPFPPEAPIKIARRALTRIATRS